MNAWANYYRAEAQARRAQASAYRICPVYDEVERERNVAFQEKLAADYERMAAEEEAHA